jgi:hypothetical protein
MCRRVGIDDPPQANPTPHPILPPARIRKPARWTLAHTESP